MNTTKRIVPASLLLLTLLLSSLLVWLPRGPAHAAGNAAVQYADSHWNCANVACTSTVADGAMQPGFECAEFVARSLAAEGLVPGLTTSSPQAGYGSYVAPNGRTYHLWWVGWANGGYTTEMPGLYQYLIENRIASDIGQNLALAAPGDVVIYHVNEGHTALLVQTGSDPLVDAHNSARYHVPNEYSDFTILHIASGSTPPLSNPPTLGPGTGSWPIISKGATGEDVVSIQLLLEAYGYSLSIDGDFGPQTAAAVEAFQSTHGLSSDGEVGPQTWPALIITTGQGSTGLAVEALQRQLNAHGASLSADGAFGPLTVAAVRTYQSSHGLQVDGAAGPQTWQSLVTQSPSTSPSGNTPATGTQPLGLPLSEQGSFGVVVEQIQAWLDQWGYHLVVDGQFGPATAQAVRAFQQSHGLSVDGIVGDATWEKLIIPLRAGSRGPAVVALQKYLSAYSAIAVDGIYGPQTENAVRTFQSNTNLTGDGIAGIETWRAIILTELN